MEKKRTFYGLMERLQDAENGMIELTPDEIKELLGDIKGKVDGVYEWVSRLDAEKERLADSIKKLQARKKAVENAKDRFKEYIGYTLTANDTPMLMGSMWSISAKPQEFIKAKKDLELSIMDYIDANRSGDIVKREYKLDSAALKKAYEAEPEKFSKWVDKETKNVVRFSARKIEK